MNVIRSCSNCIIKQENKAGSFYCLVIGTVSDTFLPSTAKEYVCDKWKADQKTEVNYRKVDPNDYRPIMK
ncbi:MAG: hypothetical protein ACRDCW_02390 [Sarcina sp.]